MKNSLINILGIFIINVLLYLAINVHQIFFYFLLNLFFIIFSLAFRKLFKLMVLIKQDRKINNPNTNEVSAEDHPIIQSARQRLNR